MSKGTRWPLKAFQDKKLIEVDGIFVKASLQVAKGKVEKIKLPPDFLFPSKIGILKQDGTIEPLDTNIDFKHTDERAYTGDPKNKFLVDEAGQWEALSAKQTIDLTLSYAHRVVKSEQERAANPDKPYFHFESPRITLPNREREVIHPKFIFDIAPCPAPRMSRSDKWKTDPYDPDPTKRQRPIVTRYFKFRDDFRELCRQQGFELDERIKALFIIPFPESYSEKKRKNLLGQPHKQRPDCDNYLKSILDSFKVDDGYVWDGRTVKIWGTEGKIIIF